jgi:(p)ppGpp synthase/HD superfamily hydrolase
MTVRDVFGCGDPDALAIAVLHDVIEDTTVDYDDILAMFGATVADGVAALTKNKSLREEERERDYDSRLARADWRARLVKLADTFDNLSELPPNDGGDWRDRLQRLVTRCDRALSLAATDVTSHEETRRAVDAVRSLLEQKKQM